MGAGILPTTIRNNKLFFLFGKENKFEDSAPGFSDFGGGTDNNETFLQTAVREGGEELTGFLGSDKDVKRLLTRHGTFTIDYPAEPNSKYGTYRTHIFPMEYDPYLELYYNNNQRFIQKRLDSAVIKKTKIFEKAEIRWICEDELNRMRKEFRPFFLNIIDSILEQKTEIKKFIKRGMKKGTKNKTLKKRR
jgi:transcription termination factor NusB